MSQKHKILTTLRQICPGVKGVANCHMDSCTRSGTCVIMFYTDNDRFPTHDEILAMPPPPPAPPVQTAQDAVPQSHYTLKNRKRPIEARMFVPQINPIATVSALLGEDVFDHELVKDCEPMAAMIRAARTLSQINILLELRYNSLNKRSKSLPGGGRIQYFLYRDENRPGYEPPKKQKDPIALSAAIDNKVAVLRGNLNDLRKHSETLREKVKKHEKFARTILRAGWITHEELRDHGIEL